MSDPESDGFVEIGIDTLRVLIIGTDPIHYKISSMIEDHYTSNHTLTEAQLFVFMELKVSCMLLKRLLGELLDQATFAGLRSVLLRPEEIMVISTLVTSVDAAKSAGSQSGISLSEH